MRAIRYQTTTGENKPAGVQRVEPTDPDGYLDRLIKFIPAETLTLFTALVVGAAARENDVMLVVLLVICFIATPLYLFAAAIPLPANQKPRPWMYLLSPLAFIVWAIFTSEPVRVLPVTDVDEGWATFILVVSVLLIPAIDQFLGAVFPRGEG
ncbi:MAG TPA: hypothetical protein VEW95_02710 [Candidatus Limnocylindrales bacterium]|nr:hypothetical protein [Candidatus Limnocylindrales bacterium]